MNPDDLEKLVSWPMPFGKYKGRLLADLPGHYLNWFARTGFPPGELGRLLALLQEMDHNGLKPLLAPCVNHATDTARPAQTAYWLSRKLLSLSARLG
ncbi:DUF3820 family protein [Neopusillimonas aromaticivorans]|uniref:DUF3820 family protein n=1 Tax=Neopusillimonas aromaticivorans TaxID=2979868 RepID=UPI002596AF2D|nr:DUF3820 family protein [Neopusillimonas aromaticivorans]WJJ93832.1 DUF3820 family protein [Neopusillimonas aromaticivorans]